MIGVEEASCETEIDEKEVYDDGHADGDHGDDVDEIKVQLD